MPLSALLQRLSGQFGSESAELEFRWMREEVRARKTAAAISSFSRKKDEMKWELGELENMVVRRLEGEPLQYILGEYGSTLPPAERSPIADKLRRICRF